MSRVGEKIKEARLKAGMTQKALGKKLGVAEKFINEVETGRKIVQESFIEKAAKVLNTDLNDVSMVVTDEALMEERKSYAESNKKPTKIETNDIRNRKILKITTGRFFNETDGSGKTAGGYVAERESRSDASVKRSILPRG